MISIKKMITIMSISTSLGFAVPIINANSSISQAKASKVWHNGTPKPMRGYWNYELVHQTGGGGNWGNFSVWENKMAEEDQGDPMLYMMNAKYKYEGKSLYLIKVLAKSNSIPSHTHTMGTKSGYILVKMINKNKMNVIGNTIIPVILKGEWFKTKHAVIKQDQWNYMND